MRTMDAFELAFAPISRQAELIAAGEVSARELVDLYLQRIERFNPHLNAFRVIFADRARMEADQADARRGAGGQRPLLGVPIAVKDEIDVAGEVTTFGTDANDAPAREDAEIVRRLRAAGAVIIGKTLMPELGMFPLTESATFGVTRNPWDPEHSPGGSSGGSGAAVAAGLVGAALAADGGGSIRIPSAYCGLFGCKPQRARVPLAPHIDAWHGLAVNGMLTRTVADTALFLDVLAANVVGGEDPGAPPPPEQPFMATLAMASGTERRTLRVAVSTNLPPSPLTRLHPDNRAAVEETADLLRSLGHQVEEHEVDHGPLAPRLEFVERYYRGIRDEVAALPHPERLERRTRAMAKVGELVPSALVAWSRQREPQIAARYNEVFEAHDVLLTPVTPAPPPRIGACEGRGWLWTSTVAAAVVPYCTPWNLIGQPACAVPAGFGADGLPRAVQLVGRPNDETTLLELATQIEAERPWASERPPGFS
jgi:amidase